MFEFENNYRANLDFPDMPRLLVSETGKHILSVQDWIRKRRPEIINAFKKYVYGSSPEGGYTLDFKVLESASNALNNTALRKQVLITLRKKNMSFSFNVLVYLPLSAMNSPCPLFLALNSGGNHTVNKDKNIFLPKIYLKKKFSPPKNFRGVKSDSYPVDKIIRSGFGFATVFNDEIEPDLNNMADKGIRSFFPRFSWGAISAWAWGLSRVMDYLEKDKHVDSSRVVVMGHSRMGKSALWCAAQDERFAMAIANNSGCTGAALSRNKKGERLIDINSAFPHWFCKNYKLFNDREDELPVDQHMLLSLLAPRPFYVSSATLDDWADQEGEFLSCLLVKPVYDLFKKPCLDSGTIPKTNVPLLNTKTGYHIREGEHNLTSFDWAWFIRFCELHLISKE